MSAQVATANRLYAHLAATYDAETRFINGIRRRAIAALALAPGDTVLDAGCGTGWCLPELASRVGPGGRVLGFEPCPDMLRLARQRVADLGLANVTLQQACGDTAVLGARPDAILFSYTHDLLQAKSALARLFDQAGTGTRIVATGTQRFPRWFVPGNLYLAHTHRATITNFDGFDAPWSLLPDHCSTYTVRRTVPGSRYLFVGVLK